ncbi:hypothetical protein [Vibrio mangrovi]|uniref:Uncharacterized protein n=1 Tax=Vibrio mangrovi TaxID=474394 RepID=A0A1Y6J1S8_9VIBR|nr:hypothetical protein [Vibrio mangrovi]MDW6005128.1 hypothetical protein [Vibrio mangrovi]SMS02662.1 hypothetical protein VIM7927_03997 [Vibrio mangrovi]
MKDENLIDKSVTEMDHNMDKIINNTESLVVHYRATVSDCISDSSIDVGSIVKTESYYAGWETISSGIPAGGNTYIKISGQSRPEDHGAIINTSDGNQLYGLFPEGIYIEQFGAISNNYTVDNTPCIKKCADFAGNQRVIKAKRGVFQIESPLNLYVGGFEFEFIDDGSGDSHLYCPTKGIDCLTITGAPSKLKLALHGEGQPANGVVLQSISHGKDIDIRVNNFAGAGCKINRMWDSLVNTISVEQCGSSDEYAFSINNDGDTSNTSTFNRIQVENSINPIFIDPETLSCTFNTIHSEGGIADTKVYTWVLGGSGCVYNAIRLSTSGVASVTISGSNSCYNAYRAEGTVVTTWLEGVNGAQITLNNPHIEGSLTTVTNQIGHYNIIGGVINGMDISSINGTVEGANITLLTVHSVSTDEKSLTFYDCDISSVIPGNDYASATFDGCTIGSYVPLFYGKFINSIVTLGGDTNIRSKTLELHTGSKYEGSVQTDNSNLIMTGGSYIGGNLTEVTEGNSRIRIDLSSYAKGGTIGSMKPKSINSYNGEFSKNMAFGIGGSIGWLYSNTSGMWEEI